MFDKKVFNECLASYKKNFSLNLLNEKYNEWEVVKCFQNNWNIDAANFAEMLTKSFKKLSRTSIFIYQFSTVMIKRFAQNEPETVRQMFKDLYDENFDVIERIEDFKKNSASLFDKYRADNEKQHAQTENAISIYLWLNDPERYYIYKKNIFYNAAEILKCDFIFIDNNYSNNLRTFYKFCDEIASELKKDTELIETLKKILISLGISTMPTKI